MNYIVYYNCYKDKIKYKISYYIYLLKDLHKNVYIKQNLDYKLSFTHQQTFKRPHVISVSGTHW